MNRKIATAVVTVLVLAMVGTIIWNEYSAGIPGRQGAGELGMLDRQGASEFGSSTTAPNPPSTRTPMPPSSPTPTPPSLVLSRSTKLTVNSVEGSLTPIPPSSLTPTPSATSTPTDTPSPTAITPTLLQVASQFGVNLRDAPAGEVIQGLPEGTLVKAYPEDEVEADSFNWLHVVTLDGVEGWLAVDYLISFSGTPTVTP